ncbi:MAG: DNA polymerase III subunit delta [Patescibacteria group bacterium]
MSLTILSGEVHQIDQELDQRLKEFTSANPDPLAVERCDLEEIGVDELVSRISTIPMFSGTRLVIIRGLEHATSLVDRLETIASAVPTSTSVLMIAPALKKNDPLLKSKAEGVEVIYFQAQSAETLVEMLIKRADSLNTKIARSDAIYLLERVGDNPLRLRSEIDKLSVHGSITHQLIDELVDQSSTSKVFDLLDAALSGDQQRALKIYEEQRDQRTDPAQVMSLIIWQLQVLSLAVCSGDTPAVLSSRSGISEYPIKKVISFRGRISKQRVSLLLGEAMTADHRIRVERKDADEAMRLQIVQIAQL